VFLLVTVSVHHCRHCNRHFRVQPPFLRKGAVYTERVREKAILSVYEDGMAIRRVADRLARDFWVSPSEAMIRRWCHEYAGSLDFSGDYQHCVVEEFSGILCVDEVYQGELALLLAVDPAVPNGDRLVGYQLVHAEVDRKKVEDFLARLRRAGIEPEQVVTDGSPLYSKTLKEVWPQAAHQLCLFHESRLVTGEIYKAIARLRKKGVPEPPPVKTKRTLKGAARQEPIPGEARLLQAGDSQGIFPQRARDLDPADRRPDRSFPQHDQEVALGRGSQGHHRDRVARRADAGRDPHRGGFGRGYTFRDPTAALALE
jgi:transposase-like protein